MSGWVDLAVALEGRHYERMGNPRVVRRIALATPTGWEAQLIEDDRYWVRLTDDRGLFVKAWSVSPAGACDAEVLLREVEARTATVSNGDEARIALDEPTTFGLIGWDTWAVEPAAIVPYVRSSEFSRRLGGLPIKRLGRSQRGEDDRQRQTAGVELQRALPKPRYVWAKRWFRGIK